VKKKRYITDFLFSTPSFLVGSATAMNLAGNFYNFNASKSNSAADSLAIENDFKMIGQDLYDVLEKFKENYPNIINAK